MKQIKTLTVNGQTYQLTDATAPRIDDATVSGSSLWSGKHTADALCPPLQHTAPAVRCSPLPGYPLEIVSHLPQRELRSLTLRHSGKNILDIAAAGVYHNNAASPATDMRVSRDGIYLTPIKDITSNWAFWGLYLGTVQELVGKTLTLSAKMETSAAATTTDLPRAAFLCTTVPPTAIRENPRYNDGGYWGDSQARKSLQASGNHDGFVKLSYTVTGEEPMPYIAIAFQSTYGTAFSVGEWTRWSDIQVEIGNTATAYTPYCGQTHTVDLGKPVTGGTYHWHSGILTDSLGGETQLAPADIRAMTGENSLWCDAGDVTVAGRTDPVAMLETLTHAIVALGGNV